MNVLIQPLRHSNGLHQALCADGWTLESASGDYFPHVLVQVDRSVFTSVAPGMFWIAA